MNKPATRAARSWVVWLLTDIALPQRPSYAPVTLPVGRWHFPQDYGSHPRVSHRVVVRHRLARDAAGEPLGFQITFFRTKPDIERQAIPVPSRRAQLLIAHCAISDPEARAALAGSAHSPRRHGARRGRRRATRMSGSTRWSLQTRVAGYVARIDAEDFSLDLELSETQASLINGDAGVSRKGPAPQAASYYYSLPHMQVAGTISRKGSGDR